MTPWIETETVSPTTSTEMVDVVFKIRCARLPVDHAEVLFDAIDLHVPWLRDSTDAGIHPVHVAASQNGWQRPEGDAELELSRRTRLCIRVAQNRSDDLIAALSGTRLDVGLSAMHIDRARLRPIRASSTLFARQVTMEGLDTASTTDAETAFVDATTARCQALGFRPTKLLCGRIGRVTVGDTVLVTRSVLFADVAPVESVKMQEAGIGDRRLYGCGLVIPHKGIDAVYDDGVRE